MGNAAKLVEVKNLRKTFKLRGGAVLKAVDGVTFDIFMGETLGLVGESGCGKTTLGRTVKGLYRPDGGTIRYQGVDVDTLDRSGRKAFTRQAQMIFQDPYSSLNPRMTVSELISEGMQIHCLYQTRKEMLDRVHELLEMVGLNKEHAGRFPHEFSGGQRQRVGIARALAVEPNFIVCDEAISALDVSIQAQVVNLFKALQRKLGLTYLFVAHDLSMVKYISDRVAVMYLGKIVEITTSRELYRNPLHPYTEFLLSAIPIPDPDIEAKKERVNLAGEMPSPINLPEGCSFASRCRLATDACRRNEMNLFEAGADHLVSCNKGKF
jgi:oligopeptide transport system ATP-binding protein